MDVENLGPAPDIENLDLSTMDRGDTIEAPKVEEPPPAEEAPPVEEAPKVEEKPAEEEQPRDDKGKFAKKEMPSKIPKERLDEEIEKVHKEREAREQAEQRAAELERQLLERERTEKETTQRSDQVKALDEKIDTLEAQRDSLILDGEREKATAISKELRELNRQVARLEAQEESSHIVSATLEKERLGVAIAKLEADHAELNPRSETYDDDLVQIILSTQRSLMERGLAPSKALYEATEKVMNKVRREVPQKEEPKVEGLSQAKQEEIADRKKAQVEKAVETQNKQPASLSETGFDSDKAGEKGLPDVSKMSADEYDALPEATRSRLRGDLV